MTYTNSILLELTLLNINYILKILVNLFLSLIIEEKRAFINNRLYTLYKVNIDLKLYIFNKISK